jgi:hypothetical protein
MKIVLQNAGSICKLTAMCVFFTLGCENTSTTSDAILDSGTSGHSRVDSQLSNDASSSDLGTNTQMDADATDAQSIGDTGISDIGSTNDATNLERPDERVITRDVGGSADASDTNNADVARPVDAGSNDMAPALTDGALVFDTGVINENDSMTPIGCIEPPPEGETMIIEGQISDRDPSYLRTNGQCQPTNTEVRYDVLHFCSAGGRSITFQFRTGRDNPALTSDGLGIFGYMNNGFDRDMPTVNCLNGQAWDAGRPPNRGTSYGFGPPLQLVVTGLDAQTRGTYRVIVCGDQLGVRCVDPADP